jgi:hypothetical protein
MVKTELERWHSVDKRIIENKLKRGEITENELKEYLKKLPDLSACMEEKKVEDKKGRSI